MHVNSKAITAHEDPEILFSRPCWVDPSGAVLPTSYNLNLPEIWQNFSGGKGNGIPSTCVVYKLDLHQSVGWWSSESKLPADYDLWTRIIARPGSSHYFINRITCLHFRANWRTEDISGPADQHHLSRIYRSIKDLPRLFAGRECDQTMIEQQYFFENFISDPTFEDQLNFEIIDLFDALLQYYQKQFSDIRVGNRKLDISGYEKSKIKAPCRFDQINGTRTAEFKMNKNAQLISIEGWAFDPKTRAMGSKAFISNR